MKYGLIGEKLSHSFSKEIHASLASYSYELCELAPRSLPSFLDSRDFLGINVTIPYKETVIPHLDEISDAARRIGAVNTIINKQGKLFGDNTDYFGMKESILALGVSPKGKKALVLGSGGTSKTARAVLEDLGLGKIITVSRGGKEDTISYEDAYALHGDAEFLVNTTPVGMYPNTDLCPIDISRFPSLECVFDVVYNPLRTRLVTEARKRNIPSSGGLLMLILQAARASELFLGTPVDAQKLKQTIENIFISKENIVLVGMPGSGKSTLGRILAEKLGRTMVDTDKEIAVRTSRHPSLILRDFGEGEFRRIESEVVLEVSKKQGLVIATGGGVVTVPENITSLRLNGVVVFIDTPPEHLPITPDRPLSADREKLLGLYSTRLPLYLASADIVEASDHSRLPDEIADEIINKFIKSVKNPLFWSKK